MAPHFQGAYRYAWQAGMMLTISTNGSLLWRPDLLKLFRNCPPNRLVVSMYGASAESFDTLTQRRRYGGRSGAAWTPHARRACRCASTSR
ncbi:MULTISPECIES: hypothetical protein [unclassified Streptomyces]|uniref:hypothetical protein n=1 Tax=unclassified Streptomyces TaxID=2593676 RepID=UPI00380247DA